MTWLITTFYGGETIVKWETGNSRVNNTLENIREMFLTKVLNIINNS